ncbi:MAG TPA: hypothetical protein VF450_11690 [Noviherbaspirillum sp.]
MQDPVSVTKSRSNQLVSFAYHPEAVARLARLDGASFDEDKKRWVLPLSLGDAADKAINDVRKILEEDRRDRANIERDLQGPVAAVLRENGTPEAPIRVSDFKNREEPTVGPILMANGGWAAQLTGFGKEDGAAFVSLHRQVALARTVFKDERVAVQYSVMGRATVSNLPPDFEKSIGKKIDGVQVRETDDLFRIEFEFNPDLARRIGRVDGARYDREEGATFVPLDKREFVARAVNDMRDTYLKTRREAEKMAEVASEHLKGERPAWAFRADRGPSMTGPVIAVGEYIVLQHTGRSGFKMHFKSDLDKVPTVGSPVTIKYDGGKATTKSSSKGKEQGYGR